MKSEVLLTLAAKVPAIGREMSTISLSEDKITVFKKEKARV